jgi:hypothetical protein
MKTVMKDLSRLDKINVNSDDIEVFAGQLDIIKKSKREVENLSEVSISEAILSVPVAHDGKKNTVHIYFNVSSDMFEFEVYLDVLSGNPQMEFSFNPFKQELIFGTKLKKLANTDGNYEMVNKLAKTYVYWVSIVSLYITYCGELDSVEVIEERVRANKKQRHKSKSSSSKYTYITRKKYTLKAPSSEERQTREIVRHVESWAVRGHFR